MSPQDWALKVGIAMQTPIYFDYSATTPVDAGVAEAMMKCLTREGNFGNPASRSHVFGWKAEEAVEQAREQVAQLINADPARSFGPVAPLSRTTWPSRAWPCSTSNAASTLLPRK